MSSILNSALLASAVLVAGATAASAQTVVATPGLYQSTGTVVSTNNNPTASPNPGANCATLGLVPGASNNSIFSYPGAGKLGFSLYVPRSSASTATGSLVVSTLLQLCNGFPATPTTGLNGWAPTATCDIYVSGNGATPVTLPITHGVTFAFVSATEDANTAIGTTTITIPSTAAVGAGCQAVVSTVTTRTGK
jgi:hypothetical protein